MGKQATIAIIHQYGSDMIATRIWFLPSLMRYNGERTDE